MLVDAELLPMIAVTLPSRDVTRPCYMSFATPRRPAGGRHRVSIMYDCSDADHHTTDQTDRS